MQVLCKCESHRSILCFRQVHRTCIIYSGNDHISVIQWWVNDFPVVSPLVVVEWADLEYVHNAAVPAIFVGLAPLTPDDYADVMATGLASMHIGSMGKCKRGHCEFPRPTEQIRDAVVYVKFQLDCTAASALPGDGSCQVTRGMKQRNEDQHAIMAEHCPPVADLSTITYPRGLDTTMLALGYLDFPTDAMKENQHAPQRYRAWLVSTKAISRMEMLIRGCRYHYSSLGREMCGVTKESVMLMR